MMILSLRDFLLSNCLGELSLSMDESEVTRLLGLPNDTLEESEYVRLLGLSDEKLEGQVGSPADRTGFFVKYGCLWIQYSHSKQVKVMSILVEDERFPQITQEVRLDPLGISRGMSPELFAALLAQESIEFTQCQTDRDIYAFQVFNHVGGVLIIFERVSSEGFVISYLSTNLWGKAQWN